MSILIIRWKRFPRDSKRKSCVHGIRKHVCFLQIRTDCYTWKVSILSFRRAQLFINCLQVFIYVSKPEKLRESRERDEEIGCTAVLAFFFLSSLHWPVKERLTFVMRSIKALQRNWKVAPEQKHSYPESILFYLM